MNIAKPRVFFSCSSSIGDELWYCYNNAKKIWMLLWKKRSEKKLNTESLNRTQRNHSQQRSEHALHAILCNATGLQSMHCRHFETLLDGCFQRDSLLFKHRHFIDGQQQRMMKKKKHISFFGAPQPTHTPITNAQILFNRKANQNEWRD